MSRLLPLLATLGVCVGFALHAAGPVAVTVSGGRLAGESGRDAAVRVFKGVPYAAPPVGPRRWKAPEPATPWTGVRSADRFAPACMQTVAGSRLPWTEEFMHQGAVDEDCLYLNVWAPAVRGARRPVFVYFYGGGFNEGSGSVPIYDGEALAKKGLVVVTVNYRVGVFGFLAHPELAVESPRAASGNYGLLDQAEALRWIQQNAAAFGGDPGNVTIAGQSAGAMSVYLLTASPRTRGLFHRAIVQSGPGALASFGVPSARGLARPRTPAAEAGVAFAKAHGASSVQALRAKPARELLAPIAGAPPARFGPVVDGWLLTDDADTVYAKGWQQDVPLLTGMNADEGSAFGGYGRISAAAFREQARTRYGDRADQFLALYPASSDAEAGRNQVRSAREGALVSLQQLAADRAVTAKTPAFLYYFDHAIPWPAHPEFGAFHTGEVPYVFANLSLLKRPWTAVDGRLEDVVSSYWVRFATNGTPNAQGLPAWPAYTTSAPRVMVLGAAVQPKTMPDAAVRRFFESAAR
jgi:para-nitrobenzyl esterase